MSHCFALLQEFVKETYFNSERELISDQPEEIVEQKERVVSVTPKDPCGCVTGNEYGIQGFSVCPDLAEAADVRKCSNSLICQRIRRRAAMGGD